MKPLVPIFTVGAALLSLATPRAAALPVYSFQRAELFAVCAGRLDALATHQKSVHDDGARSSRRMQAEFDSLLEAVMPDAVEQGMPRGQAVLWRSQGRTEIAGFLADMHYSFDPMLADLATAAANDRIGQCRALILPVAEQG